MHNPLARLRQFIVERYDLEHLRTLCFDLGVTYDELGGEGLSAKARELVLWMARAHRLDELLGTLQESWPKLFEEAGLSAEPAAVRVLYEALPAFAAGASPARQRVQIFIQGNFSSFAMDRRAAVIDALAGLLRISPRSIEIYHVYEGSIVFDLGVPFEAVRRLRSLLQVNDAQLRLLLRIEKVILETGPNETETWILREGKLSLVSEPERIDTGSGIRDLLNAALSDRELDALCFDHFRKVYDEFAAGMTRTQKIQSLVEYCTRQERFNELLVRVREINPAQYERYVASIGGVGPLHLAVAAQADTAAYKTDALPPRIDPDDPPIAAIRDLLLAAFTPEDLRRFCRDRPIFRPIVATFGPGQGLDDMVDQVIDYCQTRLMWDELLAEVAQVRPRQYARFEPRL